MSCRLSVLSLLQKLYFNRLIAHQPSAVNPINNYWPTFAKRLRKLYDRNGFSKAYRLHTLRHYFVTSLIYSGVDKQTVAELASHDDTSFLERTYCHPQMALKQQAASLMLLDMCSIPPA